MAVCKSCGAPIRWVQTPNGRWMPCDEAYIPYHRIMHGPDLVVTDDGCVINCELMFPGEPTGKGHLPHWATCPNAEKHRRARTIAGKS